MRTMTVKKIDLERLKCHLETLAVPRDAFENHAALVRVQNYIRDQFEAWGYQVEPDTFSFQGQLFQNLIARQGTSLRSATCPWHETTGRYCSLSTARSRGLSCCKRPAANPRFLIGAHFDAVPGTPGADDNASGVAALLEIAYCLADSAFVHPIDFVAFNLEEYNMIGSSHLAQRFQQQNVPLIGMLSLEMIGFTSSQPGSQQMPWILRPFYPSVGNFIALVGDTGSTALLKAAQKAFKQVPGLPVEGLTLPVQGKIFPETRLSDHSPFWDAGYPALLVTDTSFFRNPHYHGAGDTIATLDLPFLGRVVEGVLKLAEALCTKIKVSPLK
jgi:hypothetical protein